MEILVSIGGQWVTKHMVGSIVFCPLAVSVSLKWKVNKANHGKPWSLTNKNRRLWRTATETV